VRLLASYARLMTGIKMCCSYHKLWRGTVTRLAVFGPDVPRVPLVNRSPGDASPGESAVRA
jgi:hypothetical protein